MDRALPPHRSRSTLAVLGGCAAALILAYALVPRGILPRAMLSHGAVGGVALLSGVVVIHAARRPGGWRAGLGLGAALALIGAFEALFLVRDLLRAPTGPAGGTLLPAIVVGAVAILLVALFWFELRVHFDSQGRREVMADVGLTAVAAASVLYPLLRPSGQPSGEAVASSALFACSAMLVLVAWAALALRRPSPMHLGLFLVVGSFAGSTLGFGFEWIRHHYLAGQAAVDLSLGLGALAAAALLVVEPTLASPRPRDGRGWSRTALSAMSVIGTCVSLVAISQLELRGGGRPVEAGLLVGLPTLALAGRIVITLSRVSRTSEATARVLEQKDRALSDAGAGLARLTELHLSLAESEERLRMLVDAAADGIVELDAAGVIRRANDAFCLMVGLSQSRVLVRTWESLAEEVEGPAGSLAELPETGQAVLQRSGQALYLEARSSELPGRHPGRILVVRDVTAARVADQTIRSLLQFLQDRDEDRTRLLKRTNTAIEAERNRIARDLHDGPVQGVSAASLSLEAVLMLLRSGSVDKAVAMLTKIRGEISEETENLRRLMSDLRPPVLDERGLVPALRDVLARFGRDAGVRTRFAGRAMVEVPPDVETLAYRIVQEALTNAGKHAGATEVGVSVEAVAGRLSVEIVDDGGGFDPGSARDFLRAGRVGLASMRERTELGGGTLLVHSTPGGGTTIVATLPLDPTAVPAESAFA
ncbi:MAG: PAS domain-containing sensor histidine kinase [Actinomycetota bacterium]|nr:PAS domain-containing sensor histidine kinase [Actinomycetota bacterium]